MSEPARRLPAATSGEDVARTVRARLAADPSYAREAFFLLNVRAKSPRHAAEVLRQIGWPRGGAR